MKARLLFIGLLTVSCSYGQLKIVEVADLATDVNQTTVEEIGLSSDNEIIKVCMMVVTLQVKYSVPRETIRPSKPPDK